LFKVAVVQWLRRSKFDVVYGCLKWFYVVYGFYVSGVLLRRKILRLYKRLSAFQPFCLPACSPVSLLAFFPCS